MTAEMEFIKLFPYLSGCSTTSPHDMDNLLDELSLDVAEVQYCSYNLGGPIGICFPIGC